MALLKKRKTFRKKPFRFRRSKPRKLLKISLLLTFCFLAAFFLLSSAFPKQSLEYEDLYAPLFPDDLKVLASKNDHSKQGDEEKAHEDNGSEDSSGDKSSDSGSEEHKSGQEDESSSKLEKPGIPIREVPEAGKKVALTFDDGPCASLTPQYLEVLDRYNVQATFFVIGIHAENQGEMVGLILEENHELGNHSYRHNSMKGRSREDIAAELKKSDGIIEKATSHSVDFFRPPYGSFDNVLLETVKENNQFIVLWSVDPRDWTKPSSQEIVNRVLSNIQEGGIILLHEGYQPTLDALPPLIEGLEEREFEIVPLSELMEYAEF